MQKLTIQNVDTVCAGLDSGKYEITIDESRFVAESKVEPSTAKRPVARKATTTIQYPEVCLQDKEARTLTPLNVYYDGSLTITSDIIDPANAADPRLKNFKIEPNSTKAATDIPINFVNNRIITIATAVDTAAATFAAAKNIQSELNPIIRVKLDKEENETSYVRFRIDLGTYSTKHPNRALRGKVITELLSTTVDEATGKLIPYTHGGAPITRANLHLALPPGSELKNVTISFTPVTSSKGYFSTTAKILKAVVIPGSTEAMDFAGEDPYAQLAATLTPNPSPVHNEDKAEVINDVLDNSD